jgi:CRISPR-associated protein Cmr5
MSRTVEQYRAAFALSFIGCKEESPDPDKAKLSTHIHKLPSLILQCGLGQALAFLLADAGNDDKPSKWLYQAIQTWLCGQPQASCPMRVYGGAELMDELMSGTRTDYLRAQEETLLLLDWLKKFAAAKL